MDGDLRGFRFCSGTVHASILFMSRALLFREFGEPEAVLDWTTADSPELAQGDVRVRIEASPINPADVNYIQGRYGVVPELPAIPGIEGAGTVTASRDSKWKEGDRVILTGPGVWREEFITSGRNLVAVPDGVSIEQAAMGRVNPTTAWWMLHAVANAKEGDWVVQNAATSGVGRALIQIARARGIHTVNFQRGTERIAELQKLGAEFVFDDSEEGLVAARNSLGVIRPKFAFNAVGGQSMLRIANLLADGGTVVTYGAMARQPNKLPNGLLIFRDLKFCGFWLSRLEKEQSSGAIQQVQAELLGLMAQGLLKLPIGRCLEWAEYQEAVLLAKEGGLPGKVLLGPASL